MSSSRILQIVGVTGAAGVGYYLYQAGGDPKVAEKKFERDAARVSSTVKNELPGKGKEAKTEAKALGQEAGTKVDSAISQARAYGKDAEKKLETYGKDAEKKLDELRKETGKTLNDGVDKFDKNVEKGAAQTKSWLGSWFK